MISDYELDAVSEERLRVMLNSALGPKISTYLEDENVIEVYTNEDGKIWIDTLGEGRRFTEQMIAPELVERVIFIVASSVGEVCSSTNPDIAAELPSHGFRFQGVLPPVTIRPIFNIRKHNSKFIPLQEYVANGRMTERWYEAMVDGVKNKKNFLIVGGTGSGKTTIGRSLLSEIAKTGARIITIEDTLEMKNPAEDRVIMKTKPGVRDMNDCLRATMRLRPSRICIGEVRGPEALTLIKTWNTGHPGGLATAHADSAARGLTRIEQLIEESGVAPSRSFIAEAINYILYMENKSPKEFVSVSYDEKKNYYCFKNIV